MPDVRFTDEYRRLVAQTGLDPAITHEVEIKTRDMPQHCLGLFLRVGQNVEVPGYGMVRYLAEQLDDRPLVELPDGVRVIRYWQAPMMQADLTEAPRTAREYWRRVDALEKSIDELGGRLRFYPEIENGWLPVVEALTLAIVMVMGADDRVAVSTKSKFGTLRVSTLVETSLIREAVAQYIADSGDWAEAASERRCEVSGLPGWTGPLVPGSRGWLYTLSDEVRRLPAREIRRLTVPRRPAGDSDD